MEHHEIVGEIKGQSNNSTACMIDLTNQLASLKYKPLPTLNSHTALRFN